jgi:acyl-CoA synthetase (NDP forming)
MDLLAYQGKHVFAKHGVPVPDGKPADTVAPAVAAADELGYPVVVKAQVLTGGRGEAGGIKLAQDRDEVETRAGAIFGIDGDEEERTAEYIAKHVTKRVVGYIAGFTAPPGKTMGHAGAIVSGSRGTAQAKAEALEACGTRLGRTPTDVAELAAATLGAGV